jgi:ferredoxin-NADP reductase
MSTATAAATLFVCGSAGFAAAATGAVESLGVPTDRIRVERFGPKRSGDTSPVRTIPGRLRPRSDSVVDGR